MRVILASGSPRRKELLKNIISDYEVIVADCDENCDISLPDEMVLELSKRKGMAVAKSISGDALVISADTIVAYNDIILGKPSDEEDAKRMLSILSDRVHQVYTGMCIISIKNGNVETLNNFFEKTDVVFKKLSEKEIMDYIATKEPLDKAGSYGIQGLGSRFVKEIRGDYFNVVGLPVCRLYSEIEKSYI